MRHHFISHCIARMQTTKLMKQGRAEARAKRLVRHFFEHMDIRTGFVVYRTKGGDYYHPTVAQIAHHLDENYYYVRRILRSLVERGWVMHIPSKVYYVKDQILKHDHFTRDAFRIRITEDFLNAIKVCSKKWAKATAKAWTTARRIVPVSRVKRLIERGCYHVVSSLKNPLAHLWELRECIYQTASVDGTEGVKFFLKEALKAKLITEAQILKVLPAYEYYRL